MIVINRALDKQEDLRSFRATLLVLLTILLLAFSTLRIMKFYIWFELRLFPTFVLILGWGSQGERVPASMYFIIYTVFASLPLLMFLRVLVREAGVSSFPLRKVQVGASLRGSLMLGVVLLRGAAAFLVKLPVFFVHLWLVKAHVEAPVSGSMILARVLLKFGGVWASSHSKTIRFLFG